MDLCGQVDFFSSGVPHLLTPLKFCFDTRELSEVFQKSQLMPFGTNYLRRYYFSFQLNGPCSEKSLHHVWGSDAFIMYSFCTSNAASVTYQK